MSISQLFESLKSGGTLPPQLAKSIKRQEEESEFLVSLIQLAVISLFIFLYALSPVTAHPDAKITPVPWILGAYLGFTLIRLWLAKTYRLPVWLTMLSVVMDMSLLMVTIWSFHIQYMQPPSFYLKAPTVFYVFIFIALRALRFDIRYTLLAGITAALGWAAMVVYVIYSDPGDPMITRSYVEYLTSNAILIGAELDKIITILVVTAILAIAVWRSRMLLVRSVAQTEATKSLSRFFPEKVAQRIASGGGDIAAGKGVKVQAAILTMDIRDFTSLSQALSPDGLISLLTEYQEHMVPIINKNGGIVDKFLGDGILASFGAVEKTDTFAADALRAVDEIMLEAVVWNKDRTARGLQPLGIGAAVASGSTTFGIIGGGERLEYTVLGNPVNLSAKLESHTKAEKVRALATADSYDLALSQGYLALEGQEKRKNRIVGGVNQALDLVVLAP
jgi:adenylate cyclase